MKSFKSALAAGLVIIIFGIVILLIALGLNGWTLKADWESKEFTSAEEITELKLDYSAGSVTTEFYDGEEFRVEYPESKNYKTAVSAEGGKISVISSKRHWYNITLWFTEIPTAKIYIPKTAVPDLNLTLNAGTLEIGGGAYGNVNVELNAGTLKFGEITCENFNCKLNAGALNSFKTECTVFKTEMNAGSATFNNLDCADVGVEVNAGSLNATVYGEESEYSVTVEKNAGSCNLSNRTGGAKRIAVEVNAGSVNFNFKKLTTE